MSKGRLTYLFAVGQHPLGTINSLAETVLKHNVLLAFLDVVSDSCANNFGHRPTVDGRDHVQFVCLVGRQANRHCLDSFHSQTLRQGKMVVK